MYTLRALSDGHLTVEMDSNTVPVAWIRAPCEEQRADQEGEIERPEQSISIHRGPNAAALPSRGG